MASEVAESDSRLPTVLAFGLVYVIWGSTYLAIRIAVQSIPPATIGALRFLIGGLLLLSYCAARNKEVWPNRRALFQLGVVGVLLLTGGNAVVNWAERYVTSSLAALIVALVPIWVAIIEAFVIRTARLSTRGVLGLVLGLFGLLVLLWPRLHGESAVRDTHMAGAVLLMFASLSWASGSVLSKQWNLTIDPFVATAWEMIIGGTANGMLSIMLKEWPRANWTNAALVAVAYLTICGSVVAFTAYIWLLNHVSTAKVATYAYVNPVIAVVLGWLLLNEPLDAFVVAGAGAIVIAVVLVTTAKIVKPKVSPYQNPNDSRAPFSGYVTEPEDRKLS